MKHRWTYDRKRGRAKCLRPYCDETRVAMPEAATESPQIFALFGPRFTDTGPCKAKVSGGIAADK